MNNEKYTIGFANATIAKYMGYILVDVGYAGSEEETEWQMNHEEWMNKVGMTQIGRYIVNVNENTWHPWEDVKYHSSWDWSRPVWLKFRELNFKVAHRRWMHETFKDRLIADLTNGTIAEFHEGLYRAIQWYNKQKANDRPY
jgi:hypothetical protein